MECYRIAGIDVHKKMLAVVVTEAAAEGELRFERGRFGTTASELHRLAEWLVQRQVREVVMESTAQYWKPVWVELEGRCALYLAQAQSNRAPKGRKRDFADAERLLRRHLAGELILSFVPDAEQRLWRVLTRSKHQLRRDRVRLQNQLEAFLEDARLKLSSCLSDLLGVSGQRILRALAEGEQDPARLAALAEAGVRASREQLADALAAARTLGPLHRQVLKLSLQRLELIETQMAELETSIAAALRDHQDAVRRLAAVPGFGIDSAQQVIAEVGPRAASFPSPEQLASWVGTCPGREESAEQSSSNRSPKGSRTMRRLLNQVANAAVKSKGTVFQALYRRLLPRLGHNKAIWAVAHRLCRLAWKILHQGVSYEERGNRPDPRLVRKRANKLLRQLRQLGYNVRLTAEPSGAPA